MVGRNNISTLEKKAFYENGFILRPGAFTGEEVGAIRKRVEDAVGQDTPDRVFERDTRTVRALHGTHLRDDLIDRVTRLARLVSPAQELLGGVVYVYQFKVNIKASFSGDAWPWHQDYTFWRNEDGMPAPQALTAIVLLDEVNEYNGPMYVVPGSHREGCFPVKSAHGEGWQHNFSANLKYTLENDVVSELVERSGIVSIKGNAGDLILMHANMVHGSPPNISPFGRRQLFVTYNEIENVPASRSLRPDFLVTKEVAPVEVLGDDEFIGSSVSRFGATPV